MSFSSNLSIRFGVTLGCHTGWTLRFHGTPVGKHCLIHLYVNLINLSIYIVQNRNRYNCSMHIWSTDWERLPRDSRILMVPWNMTRHLAKLLKQQFTTVMMIYQCIRRTAVCLESCAAGLELSRVGLERLSFQSKSHFHQQRIKQHSNKK